MSLLKPLNALIAAVLLGVGSQAAMAGPYGDDLAKCLVSSTSDSERASFIRLVFAALGSHPQVKSMLKLTPGELDGIHREVGAMFMRLLTDTCRDPTIKALKFEGAATMEQAFGVLGESSARELFSHPDVTAAMAGLQKYVDEKKLKELGPQTAAPSQ